MNPAAHCIGGPPPLTVVEVQRHESFAFIRCPRWDDGGEPWVTVVTLDPRPEVDNLEPGPVAFMCEGQTCGVGEVRFVEPARSEDNSGDKTRVMLDTTSYLRIPPDHTGFWKSRLGKKDFTGRWEQAFSDEWARENSEDSGVAEGVGLLQCLVNQLVRSGEIPGNYFLTERERRLCGTVIQWLGTNCGRGFLEAVFVRVGAKARPSFALEKPDRPEDKVPATWPTTRHDP